MGRVVVGKGIQVLSVLLLLLGSLMSMPATAQTPDEACASCHQAQVDDWKQSDHFHAMEKASLDTVLADFNQASIDYLDGKASFSQDSQGGLWVDFVDEAGTKQHLQITYTFGYKPLQQYLFDAGNGRWQFIPFAWDSRSKEEGGERWFVLHPNQGPNDSFHWTQAGQNWNQMCADCHVTDYEKNYDLKSKSYTPSFSALNVSCNACHGDESKHIEWAKGDKSIPNKGYAVNIKQQTPIFHKNEQGEMVPIQPLVASKQVETCASCHARRAQLKDRSSPQDLVEAFTPSLLSSDLYYPDGQILDEVYVWGSFKQSKMYQQGVTCSNCHNPHSGKLKLPGNQTCTQCHSTAEYDSDAHHKHEKFKQGNQCVDCHMPATTYMQVDPRRDHSFKIPRPDLTLSTGAPNACNRCHTDEDANWSVEQLKTWQPAHPKNSQSDDLNQQVASVFHQVDNGALTDSKKLAQIAQNASYPDIVRASALERMENFADSSAADAIAQAVQDSEPLKRLGAIDAAQGFPIFEKWKLLSPLLNDDKLAIRSEAGLALATIIPDFVAYANLTPKEKEDLNAAIEEYKEVQAYQADRGFSHVALGNLALNLKDYASAEKAFQTAIDVEPIFIPAYVNLADVYRLQKQELKAQAVLDQGIKLAPENAALYYAQAMSYIRAQDKAKALKVLAKASQYAPNNVEYNYTYALLLKDQGQTKQSVQALTQAYNVNKDRPDLAYALVQAYVELKDYRQALVYAKEMQRLVPTDRQIGQLISQLESGINQ